MHKVALEKPSLVLRVVNLAGMLGYISLLIEWLWITCLLAYPLIKNGDLNWVLPVTNPVPSPIIAPAPVNGLTFAVGLIVTVICLGITAYVLYTIPRNIGKTGSRITRTVADSLTPALTKHQKISKKTKRMLTFRAVMITKLSAALLPVIVAIIAPFTALSKDIVLLTTIFLASWAVLDFAVQFTITKVAKLNTDRVW